jgi:hypothetical protein
MVRYEHSKAEAMSRYSDSCLVVLGRQFCVRRLFETLRDSGFGVDQLQCCPFLLQLRSLASMPPTDYGTGAAGSLVCGCGPRSFPELSLGRTLGGLVAALLSGR